jgi:hypothetical protein
MSAYGTTRPHLAADGFFAFDGKVVILLDQS